MARALIKPNLRKVIQCEIIPNERPDRTAFWPGARVVETPLIHELKNVRKATTNRK